MFCHRHAQIHLKVVGGGGGAGMGGHRGNNQTCKFKTVLKVIHRTYVKKVIFINTLGGMKQSTIIGHTIINHFYSATYEGV